jgi:hypothetical protein
VNAPPGYLAIVQPQALFLAHGESASYTVTFRNMSAPNGEWRFGSLTWQAPFQFKATSPIAVRGTQFAAPTEIQGSGASGSASFNVKFGYNGPYSAVPSGLVPATQTNATVKQDPDQTFAPTDVAAGGANVHEFALNNAAVFRVAIPPDATEADADLDVFVFNPSGTLVASSTLGGTDEEVTIQNPANGTWKVYVHGWQTIGPDSAYTLSSWVVPPSGGGNLQVTSAPASATLGATGTVTVAWTGAGGTWNLGAVNHMQGGTLLGRTLVEVDNS